MWNYTKTALLILAGVLIFKLVAESGTNIYRAGGAVPTMILAFLVLAPAAVTADLVARWRSRRAERRASPPPKPGQPRQPSEDG